MNMVEIDLDYKQLVLDERACNRYTVLICDHITFCQEEVTTGLTACCLFHNEHYSGNDVNCTTKLHCTSCNTNHSLCCYEVSYLAV